MGLWNTSNGRERKILHCSRERGYVCGNEICGSQGIRFGIVVVDNRKGSNQGSIVGLPSIVEDPVIISDCEIILVEKYQY